MGSNRDLMREEDSKQQEKPQQQPEELLQTALSKEEAVVTTTTDEEDVASSSPSVGTTTAASTTAGESASRTEIEAETKTSDVKEGSNDKVSSSSLAARELDVAIVEVDVDEYAKRHAKAMARSKTGSSTVKRIKGQQQQQRQASRADVPLQIYLEEAECLQQIEPLPAPQEQQHQQAGNNKDRGPGAYAVVGAAPYHNLRHNPYEQHQQHQEPQQPPEALLTLSNDDGGGGSRSMAVATAVYDEEEGMKVLQTAESFNKRSGQHPNKRSIRNAMLCFFLYALAAIALVVTLLVVFVGGNNNHTEPQHATTSAPPTMATLPPTSPPTTERHAYVVNLLPEYTLETLSSSSSLSPQARALDWLLEDPSLMEYPEWRIRQRFALATFYYATGGDVHWLIRDDWLSYTVHECLWFSRGDLSFTHDPINTFFDVYDNPCEWMLSLDDHNNGTLATMDNNKYGSTSLTMNEKDSHNNDHFKHFWLYMNNMTGTLPPEMFLLTDVRTISIYGNHLQGTIDTRMGQLTKMEHLAVAINEFTGTIPSELGQMSLLRKIGLFMNQLTSTIPSELGNLSGLWYLFVDNNQLTGTFPPEIFDGDKTDMIRVRVDSNQLSGSLPATIGKTSSLISFDASRNHFASTLCTDIGTLDSLQKFNVQHNEFSGTIPTQIGHLSSAMLLDLSYNRISGTIPSEIGLLAGSLDVFEASMNSLQGTLPAAELNSLSEPKAFHFVVSDNQLTGTTDQIKIQSFATFNVTGNRHLDSSSEGGSSSLHCWVDTEVECSMGDSTVATPHCQCDCAC